MQRFISLTKDGIRYQIGIPEYPLSLWVDHFFWSEGTPAFSERRIFPNNHIDLFFNLGSPNNGVLDKDAFTFRESIISGLRTNYMTVMPTGSFRVTGLRFTLFGFSDLWKVPAREIANKNFSASDVLGQEINTVRDRLLECKEKMEQFRALEEWINSKIQSKPEDIHEWSNVESRFRQINFKSRTELPSVLGYSYKHAIKLVVDKTGIPPKMIKRIYRLNKMLREIGLQESGDWGDLAFSNGFSDQSHMIREIRTFTGFTPGQFVSQRQISTDNALRVLR